MLTLKLFLRNNLLLRISLETFQRNSVQKVHVEVESSKGSVLTPQTLQMTSSMEMPLR